MENPNLGQEYPSSHFGIYDIFIVYKEHCIYFFTYIFEFESHMYYVWNKITHICNMQVLLLMATALNVSVPQPSPRGSFDNRTMYEIAMYSWDHRDGPCLFLEFVSIKCFSAILCWCRTPLHYQFLHVWSQTDETRHRKLFVLQFI